MVRTAGLEPARACARQILSLLCLPISPRPRTMVLEVREPRTSGVFMQVEVCRLGHFCLFELIALGFTVYGRTARRFNHGANVCARGFNLVFVCTAHDQIGAESAEFQKRV